MAASYEIAIRGTERVFQLTDGKRLTVGRVPQCEIHLDDQAGSRRHCTLDVRESDLIVTDLGSANGTIPPIGRLLGIADFLDALTSARSYRQPMALRDAVQLVVEGSGTQFDSQFAEAVVRLYANGTLLPPEWDACSDAAKTRVPG